MRPALNLDASGVLVLGALAAAAMAAVYVSRNGVATVAGDLVTGVAEAAGAAVDAGVTAGVTVASEAVGLPTPAQTTTDAAVARWLIDNVGQWEASKWASAGAYLSAQFMTAGSGTAPARDSAVGRAFADRIDAADETARLLARYPAPASAEPAWDWFSWGP